MKSAASELPFGAEVHPSFAPIMAAFDGDQSVRRRRMFGSEDALSVNGKIFAMFFGGKLVAKLPQTRVEELVQSGRGKRFDLGDGRPMRAWVAIDEGAVPWVLFAKEAHRFVWRGKR